MEYIADGFEICGKLINFTQWLSESYARGTELNVKVYVDTHNAIISFSIQNCWHGIKMDIRRSKHENKINRIARVILI